jgi:uncharacterized surface protein with fasciclin (FAS1) repeats
MVNNAFFVKTDVNADNGVVKVIDKALFLAMPIQL